MEKDCHSILVLGNGFDLQCELRSSFKYFFDTIVEKDKYCFSINATNETCNIWYLLFYFAFACKNETRNGEHIGNYRGPQIIERIDNDDPLWMDIESFIKKIVTESYQSTNPLFDLSKTYIEALNLAYEKCHNDIYLCNSDQFCLLKKHFKNKGENKIDDIYKYLCDQLNGFKNDFSDYLSKQLSGNVSYDNKTSKLLSKLVDENEESTFLLTFNYTFPNVDATKFYCYNDEPLFVHGSLIDKNIIIGYDSSDAKCNTDHCLYLSKAWQKMDLGLKSINLPQKEDIRFLKFYGHSLGEQDYSYFHALFDIYDIYSNQVHLVFYYSTYGEAKNKIKTKYIKSIYALLDNYAQRSNREKEHRTLISRLQLENRLSIIKI